MKKYIFILTLFLISANYVNAQSSKEKKIIQLSMDKWHWMADKDIEKLTPLFHPKAKFVHMSGTWTMPRELEIIENWKHLV